MTSIAINYTRPILWIIAALLLTAATSAFAEERIATEVSPSFLGKLFGKQEDFAELKRLRRQLIAEIGKAEREIRTLETQAEQLTQQLEDAPVDLARLNTTLRNIDRLLAEAASQSTPSRPSSKPQDGRVGIAQGSFGEFEFLATRPPAELRVRKQDLEQRVKDIAERQQRLSTNRDDQRKKRDELDLKQARLVELEDRISVALSTGTNQYLYRTVVSLIFAGIVAFLVKQFFAIVQQNEEVKKSIFTGDTGIQFLTLFSIVIAVILFGILEILGANELSALLGGLSGYILGKSTTRSPASDALYLSKDRKEE